MSSTPQFTTGQLQAARAKAWHQTGEPLLTLEAAREWIDTAGLLLFAPQPQLAPAPSFIEATLGEATEAPSMAQTATARSLAARLVAEGNALPLNLLGGPGEAPDFIVSAQMFSFVFTLRGDKLWKQAPATSGAVKVSPLSLGVYELLAERGSMTATELASELGREVTEAAILRSLNELWTHLRVIPLQQQGDAATMWELTSRRFTKAIKAGINAGQPTALSALVSLYLNQSLLATEDEVAGFLSPLAPRSRIREVVHALTAGRQLEPVVLEGKTLLHIPGTLPEFPEAEVATPAEDGEASVLKPGEGHSAEDGRIKRFTRAAGDRPVRGDFKGKPARSFGAGGTRPSRPASPAGERERRPFRRDAAADSTARPAFNKPWDEERKPRSSEGEERTAPEKRPYIRNARPEAGRPGRREAGSGRSDRGPARRSFGDKPPFRKDRGEGFSSRPRPSGDSERRPYVRRESTGASEGGERKPRFDRAGSNPGGFAAKRPYVRRDAGDGGGESRPPRRTFDSAERKPGGFGAKRPYVRRDSANADGGDARPPRRSFGGGDDRKPGGFAPKRPYIRRDGADAAGEGRPPRRTFDGKEGKAGGFPPKRPYVRRDSGEAGGESRPVRPSFGAKRAFGDKPAGRPSRGPSGPGTRSGSGSRPSRPGFGGKPGGGGFKSRPSGKVPFGGKPGSGRRPGAGGQSAPRRPRTEE